ncbi:MAG: signal peptidase I [Verrucomicrobiia bacterium]
MKRRTKLSLALAAVAVVLFLVMRFVVTPYVVVGDSMLPTLKSWDFCLMARVHGYQPRRGDIVTFRTADDPPLYFIKRVVGLPGETLAIRHGVVTVNGQPLDEPYTTMNPMWEMESVEVPTDKVFVLGDERTVPLDDTLHGLVAMRLVKARMLWHWRWKK